MTADPPSEPEEIPLPELHEAILDAATLDDLFTDLELMTEALEVRVKGGPEHHSAASTDLGAARALLENGEARAIQICYRHRGKRWVDTLMRLGTDIKLVRMQVQLPE